MTCDKDNPASARVIRKCGGRLDSEGYSPPAGRVTQRYWIEAGTNSETGDQPCWFTDPAWIPAPGREES